MRRKKYIGWVIELVRPSRWTISYFNPDIRSIDECELPKFPYDSHGKIFKSRVEAELAILPRIHAGYVGKKALILHRRYRWVDS